METMQNELRDHPAVKQRVMEQLRMANGQLGPKELENASLRILHLMKPLVSITLLASLQHFLPASVKKLVEEAIMERMQQQRT